MPPSNCQWRRCVIEWILAIMKIFIVVPTIRDLSFLDEWKNQFTGCSLVVVEDHAKRETDMPSKGFKRVYHYCWEDIRKDFGAQEWIFPRKNAGIRSYGFWKAYGLGADAVITLDDDCYPVDGDFVRQHVDNLKSKAPAGWFTTFPHPKYMYTRGFPYTVRNKKRVVVSHGLWSNKMDMDARTELAIGNVNIPAYAPMRQFVPPGNFFPMSSMNLAFTREVLPLMYFPLMGSDPKGKPWGFDRYDDIWAGIFAKKILDHFGLSVVSGSPFVEHRKASNVTKNLKKERLGMKINEKLWEAVNEVNFVSRSIPAAYRELARKVDFPKGKYFASLRQAMSYWGDLF